MLAFYMGLLCSKAARRFHALMKDESGLATLEMVLLVCILIALALMFKDTIIDFVAGVLDSIAGQGSAFDPGAIIP